MRMKHLLVSLALLGMPAPAAQAAYVEPGPIPHWQILPDKSRVEWTVDYSGHELTGVFPEITGYLLFDSDRLPPSRGGFKIPTVNVISADKDAQDYLPTRDWLDSDEYPNATFETDVANSFTHLEGNHYNVTGQLMIHGRHTKISLPFTLILKTDPQTWTPTVMAVCDAVINLKRLDYNVGIGDWADTSALSNDVRVHVHIEARKMQ